MVKYIIADDDIWNLVDQYEYFIEKIQGFNYGGIYVIRDLRKPRGREQEIWWGHSFEELKLQLKTERARAAINVAAEKIIK